MGSSKLCGEIGLAPSLRPPPDSDRVTRPSKSLRPGSSAGLVRRAQRRKESYRARASAPPAAWQPLGLAWESDWGWPGHSGPSRSSKGRVGKGSGTAVGLWTAPLLTHWGSPAGASPDDSGRRPHAAAPFFACTTACASLEVGSHTNASLLVAANRVSWLPLRRPGRGGPGRPGGTVRRASIDATKSMSRLVPGASKPQVGQGT